MLRSPLRRQDMQSGSPLRADEYNSARKTTRGRHLQCCPLPPVCAWLPAGSWLMRRRTTEDRCRGHLTIRALLRRRRRSRFLPLALVAAATMVGAAARTYGS